MNRDFQALTRASCFILLSSKKGRLLNSSRGLLLPSIGAQKAGCEPKRRSRVGRLAACVTAGRVSRVWIGAGGRVLSLKRDGSRCNHHTEDSMKKFTINWFQSLKRDGSRCNRDKNWSGWPHERFQSLKPMGLVATPSDRQTPSKSQRFNRSSAMGLVATGVPC